MVVGISYFVYKHKETTEFVHDIKSSEPFCGTISISFSEKSQKGRDIFNSNCAACHNLHKKMTGSD